MKNSKKHSHRYVQLEVTNYTVHDMQRPYIDEELLESMEEFASIEMYPKEKILTISENNEIQDELNRLIKDLLEYRKQEKNGNNEAMCQSDIVDFLSKLDVLDFRTLNIEKLLTVSPEKTPEEKATDKKRQKKAKEEFKKIFGKHFEK